MIFAALTPDFFMLRSRSFSRGIATSTVGIPYSMFISSIARIRYAALYVNSPSHLHNGCGLAIYFRYHKPVSRENYRSQLSVVRDRNAFLRLARSEEHTSELQ